MTSPIGTTSYDFRSHAAYTLAWLSKFGLHMSYAKSLCPIERATTIYVVQHPLGNASGATGTGTSGNPYQVDTLDNLQTFLTNNKAADTRIIVRGSFVGANGLSVSQDDFTLQFGDSQEDGIVSSFVQVSMLGTWGTATGTKNTIEVTRTSFNGADDTGYPIVAIDPFADGGGIPCSVWNGAGDVDDDYKSHLELSGSGDTLTVDYGDSHDEDDVYIAISEDPGIIFGGDGACLAFGTRESGFRGWGSWQSGSIPYAIRVTNAAGAVTRVTGGSSFYGSEHTVGRAGSGNGAVCIIDDHRSAYTMDFAGGATVVVQYADSGGEFYADDIEITGSTIKGDYLGSPVPDDDGLGYYSHAQGANTSLLCAVRDITVTNSAHSSVANFENPINIANGDPVFPDGGDITDVRGFAVACDFNIPESNVNNALTYLNNGNWIDVGCRWRVSITDSGTNAHPVKSTMNGGFALNPVWEIGYTGWGGSGTASFVRDDGNLDSMMIDGAHFEIDEKTGEAWRLDGIARTVGATHSGRKIRLVNSTINPTGSGSTPSVNVKNDVPGSGSEFGGLENIQVNDTVRQADGTDWWGVDDSGVDTVTTAEASMPAVLSVPDSDDPRFEAGGTDFALLEYDFNGSPRHATPSIGPLEPATPSGGATHTRSSRSARDDRNLRA